MGQDYFLAVNGQQRGPFPIDRLVAEGLTPATLVWAEGMTAWQPAQSVPELAALWPAGLPVAAPPPMYPTAPVVQYGGGYPYAGAMPADIGTKKLLCGLMALLLGGWGVHRFILGDVGGGILRIVLTFVTCGLASILYLVEGIIYLTKTDEEFYRIYIVEKRSWF